jgi:hypothetical protein
MRLQDIKDERRRRDEEAARIKGDERLSTGEVLQDAAMRVEGDVAFKSVNPETGQGEVGVSSSARLTDRDRAIINAYVASHVDAQLQGRTAEEVPRGITIGTGFAGSLTESDRTRIASEQRAREEMYSQKPGRDMSEFVPIVKTYLGSGMGGYAFEDSAIMFPETVIYPASHAKTPAPGDYVATGKQPGDYSGTGMMAYTPGRARNEGVYYDPVADKFIGINITEPTLAYKTGFFSQSDWKPQPEIEKGIEAWITSSQKNTIAYNKTFPEFAVQASTPTVIAQSKIPASIAPNPITGQGKPAPTPGFGSGAVERNGIVYINGVAVNPITSRLAIEVGKLNQGISESTERAAAGAPTWIEGQAYKAGGMIIGAVPMLAQFGIDFAAVQEVHRKNPYAASALVRENFVVNAPAMFKYTVDNPLATGLSLAAGVGLAKGVPVGRVVVGDLGAGVSPKFSSAIGAIRETRPVQIAGRYADIVGAPGAVKNLRAAGDATVESLRGTGRSVVDATRAPEIYGGLRSGANAAGDVLGTIRTGARGKVADITARMSGPAGRAAEGAAYFVEGTGLPAAGKTAIGAARTTGDALYGAGKTTVKATGLPDVVADMRMTGRVMGTKGDEYIAAKRADMNALIYGKTVTGKVTTDLGIVKATSYKPGVVDRIRTAGEETGISPTLRSADAALKSGKNTAELYLRGGVRRESVKSDFGKVTISERVPGVRERINDLVENSGVAGAARTTGKGLRVAYDDVLDIVDPGPIRPAHKSRPLGIQEEKPAPSWTPKQSETPNASTEKMENIRMTWTEREAKAGGPRAVTTQMGVPRMPSPRMNLNAGTGMKMPSIADAIGTSGAAVVFDDEYLQAPKDFEREITPTPAMLNVKPKAPSANAERNLLRDFSIIGPAINTRTFDITSPGLKDLTGESSTQQSKNKEAARDRTGELFRLAEMSIEQTDEGQRPRLRSRLSLDDDEHYHQRPHKSANTGKAHRNPLATPEELMDILGGGSGSISRRMEEMMRGKL